MNKSRAAVPRGRRLPLLAAAMPPAAPPPGSTADCNSVTTCYTPQQIQVAYGITPLLDRGINGRGETVVLPELAESLGCRAEGSLLIVVKSY